GGTNPNATTYASDTLVGFGARPNDWQFSASVQQELRSRIALNVGYFRTWWGSFTPTENKAVTPADFDPYCITAPVDSRLPGGGGNQICGLFDVKPNLFGLTQNVVTQASHYGTQREIYNGLDVGLNARPKPGLVLQGGFNVGRTQYDNCDVVLGRPQILFIGQVGAGVTEPLTRDFCDVHTPWLTQLKLSSTFGLPYGFRTGVTYQNIPGIPDYATYVATNAQIVPSLGRNLAAGTRGVATVDLFAPYTRYEDRVTQVDLRFSRVFRFSGQRVEAQFDIYNALNASPILSVNTRYGASWL